MVREMVVAALVAGEMVREIVVAALVAGEMVVGSE